MQAQRIPILIMLVIFTIFGRVVFFDFVNLDDQAHIEANAAVKNFDLLHIWTHEHKDMFIPVLSTALAVEALVSPKQPTFNPPNVHIKNLDPFVFHLTSLLFHTANCVLVFYFLLGFGFLPWLAGFGALLYGLHPLQVEVVSWVSAQKDLISSFWGLLSLLYFRKYFIDTGTRGAKNYFILGALVLAALLSKPTTVILAPIMLFWWVYVEGKDAFKAGLNLFMPILLSFIFSLVTIQQQPGTNLPFQTNLLERLWVALDTITFYTCKLFLPINLIAEYGWNPPALFTSPERFWTWLPALVMLTLLWRGWRRLSAKSQLGFAIIGIAIFPVLGIKSFVYQNVSTVADRYMSFPLIGVALIVCAGLQNVLAAPQNTKPTKKSSHKTNLVQVELSARARKIMVSAGLIILIICAAISLKIQTNWRNIDALWSRTIAVNPNSWFAYRNWAAHYEELGQRQRAIELYEKSLALKPDSMVYTRVGIMYFDEKNAEKARQAFTEAVRLDPTNAVAAQNLRLL